MACQSETDHLYVEYDGDFSDVCSVLKDRNQRKIRWLRSRLHQLQSLPGQVEYEHTESMTVKLNPNV